MPLPSTPRAWKKTGTSYKKGKKVYAYAYAILDGEKYYTSTSAL
jgi:hypothetical protein